MGVRRGSEIRLAAGPVTVWGRACRDLHKRYATSQVRDHGTPPPLDDHNMNHMSLVLWLRVFGSLAALFRRTNASFARISFRRLPGHIWRVWANNFTSRTSGEPDCGWTKSISHRSETRVSVSIFPVNTNQQWASPMVKWRDRISQPSVRSRQELTPPSRGVRGLGNHSGQPGCSLGFAPSIRDKPGWPLRCVVFLKQKVFWSSQTSKYERPRGKYKRKRNQSSPVYLQPRVAHLKPMHLENRLGLIQRPKGNHTKFGGTASPFRLFPILGSLGRLQCQRGG